MDIRRLNFEPAERALVGPETALEEGADALGVGAVIMQSLVVHFVVLTSGYLPIGGTVADWTWWFASIWLVLSMLLGAGALETKASGDEAARSRSMVQPGEALLSGQVTDVLSR